MIGTVMWTKTQIEYVVEQWDAGFSASIIGDALGKTRNAVLGKIHRMGLSGSRENKRKPQIKKQTGGQRGKRRNSMRVNRAPVKLVSTFKPVQDIEPEPIDASQNCKLFELENHQCKWPVNDPPPAGYYMFCGLGKKVDSPYCRQHHKIAYRPAKGQIIPLYVKN